MAAARVAAILRCKTTTCAARAHPHSVRFHPNAPEHHLPPPRFPRMDREPRKSNSDLLGSLVWALGACALAVLVIALFVWSAPRKAPRLNTTPGMTTGEQLSMHDHLM